METKQTKPSGIPKLLTVLLCVLLAVSLVFNVVFYVNNNDLNTEIDTLTDDNASLTAELDDMTAVAAQSEADLTAANETIGQLEAEAAEAEEAIASQANSLDALQTEFDSLTATAAQSEADLTAANETIGQLEAEAAEAQVTIAAQASSLEAAQTEYANLADSLAQSEADLLAANETIASLQDDLDALQQPETDADSEPTVSEEAEDTVSETSAEDADVAEETEAEDTVTFASEDVLATVNGEDVTGDSVLNTYQQIVNYYGEPDTDSLELYYAVALEEAITLALIYQAVGDMGLELTQEELDTLYATSDSDWDSALDDYVSYYYTITDETTDEEREAAYAEAEDYYGSLGYSKESLRQSYLEGELYERVQTELCKDVAVTDEDVQSYFDEAVQADKEIYENDLDSYESQVLMYQYGYADQEPWYKPEGRRYIKHILLEVDEELLTNYTDLLALYEEEDESVTAEDVEAAKALIIESIQATIDEINQKLADGAAFEDLIAEYGADTGMTSGDYPDGYEVSLSSYGFVEDFVTGSFSVDTIGDISEPFVSEYGVHIIKYMGDVPAGPIELTEDMQESIYESLLEEKNDEVLNAWYDSADIVYCGVIRSYEEIQAGDAE